MLSYLVLTLTTLGLVQSEGTRRSYAHSCYSNALETHKHHCKIRNKEVIIEMTKNPETVWVKCEGGGFDCEELPPLEEFNNVIVPNIVLDTCKLPRSGVGCLLRALGGSGGTYLKLVDVPGGALLEMQYAHLEGLPLRKLEVYEYPGRQASLPAALQATPNLTDLIFTGANLSLGPFAFTMVPHLKLLKLVGCGLTNLPPGGFAGLKQLQKLVITKGRMSHVDSRAFEGLAALEQLEVSTSTVHTLALDVFAPLVNLRQLKLIRNEFVELNSSFSGLTRLEEFHLENTVELRMSQRALAFLPALIIAILSHCKLKDLPPDTFRGSVALEKLDLSYNYLKHLTPKHFQDQRNLQILNLRKNYIEELPNGVFSGLDKIEKIDLSSNHLRVVAADAFQGVGPLRLLTLANNQLSSDVLITSSFYLPSLEDLNLSYNNISTLQDDWRISLTNLKSLNLSHNSFSFLKPEVDFSFIQENIIVDLRWNNIKTIVPSRRFNITTAKMASSSKILLEQNQTFICDCHLYEFLAWQQYSSVADRWRPELGAAQCGEPNMLRGALLYSMQLNNLRCAATSCPAGCSCDNEPASRLLHLTCTNPPSNVDFDSLVADTQVYNVDLQLTRNPSSEFILHQSVVELNLTRLNLTKVPPGLLLHKPVKLDLTWNQITFVPLGLLSDATPQLWLKGNPLECNCFYAAEVSSLKQHSALIADYSQVNCSSGERLESIDTSALCHERNAAFIGGSLTVLGFLFAVGALLAFLYRRELYYLALRCGMWRDPDFDKPYDAFVSFCHRDHWFVMDQLVAQLESGARPLRLCLHHRDWLGGAWVPEQIARSVRDSRRTLLVLSENYLRSRWSLLEFRAALECALHENRVRLVVVMLRDVTSDPQLPEDLRAYLRVNTYLVWGEPHFWRQLRAALPPPRPLDTDRFPEKLTFEWLTASGARVENTLPLNL